MSFSVTTHSDQQTVTIHLPERFTFENKEAFYQAYKSIDPATLNWVVDFSKTKYLDSPALGMLVSLQKYTAGKSITLKGASEDVREILKMVHFHKLFNIA